MLESFRRSFAAGASLAALALFSLAIQTASADPYPPAWNGGTVNEASGPIHFAPVAWPSEPTNPADCGNACGDWKPYTRFQAPINDPRTQDPSNGGTAPQNYVNVSSSCVDKTYPSIYYYLYKHPTDASKDVLMFRWRVEQIANTYGTGPSAGNYGATDTWNSALWTVFFDINGDGYRDLAAHLDGSSGSPSKPVDRIAGIWGNVPTQSLDYLIDPNIKLIAHNPTAFTSGSMILNFHGTYPTTQPDTTWPAGSTTNTWDYGTSRSRLVSTNACNEYFVDYQIPVRMLDASASGPNPSLSGPKITRSTPISMLFCTANSLNDPFQKDCSLNRTYLGDTSKPGPFGDYLSFSRDQPYVQPIVSSVSVAPPGTCPGNYKLSAVVQDTIYVDSSGVTKPSIKSVQFFYWHDKDGDGAVSAGDTGSAWTYIGDGTLKSGTLNTWTTSWNPAGLLRGHYLIGVQAVDDKALHDDGVPDGPVDHRTFSYVIGSTDATTLGSIYSNDWSWDANNRAWVHGGNVGWLAGQQALFPAHSPTMTPGTTEDWYGNPDATGTQIASAGIDPTLNICGIAPSITKSADVNDVIVGNDVAFTVTVANPAGNTSNVTVTQIQDVLPSGFTYKPGSTTGLFGTADPSNSANTLTWTGTPVAIAAGASSSLTFKATAVTTGAYSNTATAGTNEFATLTSAPVQVGIGAPTLTVSKVPSAYSTTPGSTVTYSIRYSNDSPVNATGVTLTDALPTGITYVAGSCTGGCSYTSGTRTLNWTIGNLASGEGPYTVTFQATIDSPYTGAATNQNTVAIDSDQTSPATAKASVYIDSPHPALTIKKTADKTLVDPAAASPGNQVTFTIAYANVGNASATNIVIRDTLPTGFTFVSATGSPSATPAVGANGTVTWTIASLAANASGSVTVTATATASAAASTTNTASIYSTELPTPVADSAAVGVKQNGQVCSTYYFRNETGSVGFDGTKQFATLSPTPVTGDVGGSTLITVPGGANNYSPTVLSFYQDPATTSTTTMSGNVTTTMYIDRNAGPGITIRASVYDYDSGSGTRTQLGQSTTGFTGSQTGQFSFTVALSGTLSKNHRLLWTYEATSNNVQSTDLLFQYDGTVPNSISDTTPPIITTFSDSKANFCVTAPANLTLEKTVSATSVNVTGTGRTLTYTLNYANTSSATAATNVVLTDTLPAGTTFVSATGGGTHSGASPDVVTWNLGTVAAGTSGSLSVTVNVANDLTSYTSLLNSASIVSTETVAVSATAETVVSGIVTSNPSGTPNVLIAKQADKTTIGAGETVTYTLTAVNAGDKTATSVIVTDNFPDQSFFVFGSCTTLNGTCGESGGILTWTIGSLNPGQTATLAFSMTAGSGGNAPPGGITPENNTATVAYGGGGTGSSSSDPVTVSLSTQPDLSMTKSVTDINGGTVVPGDKLGYSIVVTNNGSGGANNVVVTDPVPANTGYSGSITASTGSGTFDPMSNSVVFNVGSLAPGASATLTFQVTVAALPSGTTTLSNTATVAASNAASRSATAAITATLSPLMVVSKTGPTNVAYPAALLTADAINSSVILVSRTSALIVGQYVMIGSTVARITALTSNSLTLSAPVSAATGSAVVGSASYLISYQNSGNADASGVVVTDALPANWAYVAANPAPTSAPAVGATGTISWTVGTVAVGSGATLQVIAVPLSVGSATNTATVTDNDYCTGGTPPATCSNSHLTTAGGLSVTKSTSTPNAVAGGSATWTILVTNSLATSVGGVDVTDVLPPGFTYRSTDSIVAAGASRTTTVAPASGDTQPMWGTWTLPGNGTLSITFTANVAPSVGPATYQNEATVTTTTSNTGVMPFDPLLTTAEDVTVLSSGTGLVDGIVYRDVNGNGVFDASVDMPLPGVSVTLIDDTGVSYVVSTDSSGYFSRVVSAGATIVDVNNATLPAGLVLTTGSNGVDPSTVTVPDGGVASRNTGYVQTPAPGGTIGDIAGNVWRDANANAAKDSGETNWLGIEVILRDGTTGNVVATAYTDVYGNYSFPSLATGSYRVDVVPPTGYYISTANDPAPVTVSSGATATANFGIAAGRVLSGTVFRDNGAGGGTAADGLQNGTEPSTNAGGLNVVMINGSDVVVAVAAVPSGGAWSATVPQGSGYAAYITTASPAIGASAPASVALPSGWLVTKENLGGVVDATANGILTGINATSDVSGINFGLETAATTFTIVGQVFRDSNGDGTPDAGEPGTNAGGLYALLLDGSGNVIASSAVASDGSWTFAGVADGNYTVRLSSVPGTVGNPAPAAALPTGWFNTGESLNGSTTDGSADGNLAVSVSGAPVSGLTQGIRQRADVIVQKNGPLLAAASGTVTYAVRIDNAGPAAADGTVVTDAVPTGMTNMTWNCGKAIGGAACPNASGSGAINETIAALPAGGSLTYTVTATAPAAGSISNSASATVPAAIVDPNPANNSGGVTTPVGAVPAVADLSVVKYGPASVLASASITYSVVVGNAGPAAANGADFTDNAAAAGLTGVTWTCGNATGGAVCPNASGNNGTIHETIATFPAGSSLTYTVTGTMPASGPITNTAAVYPPTGVADPDASNDASNQTTNVVVGIAKSADLAIAKTGTTNVQPSGDVTYRLVVSNSGPDAVASARVRDAVPALITGVSWTCGSGTGGGTCNTAGGSGNVLDTTVNLPVGATVTIVIAGTAPATAISLANAARVVPPADTVDPNPANNVSGTVITNVTAAPDVYTQVTAPATATVGSTVSVGVTFGNQGSVAAGSVSYQMQLPAGLAGVGCTGATCVYDSATGALAISGLPATLNPGQSVAISVAYTAPAPAGTGVQATSLIGTTTPGETPPTNNTASATTSTTAVSPTTADPASTISAPPTATAGSTVGITATFSNPGPATATGVTFALRGMAAGAVVRYNGVQCTWNSGTGAVTGCGLPTTLAVGQTVALTASYIAPTSGTVAVTSAISASNDSNSSNNESTASTSVISAPSQVEAIPSLSEAALMMLSLLMAMLAYTHTGRNPRRAIATDSGRDLQ